MLISRSHSVKMFLNFNDESGCIKIASSWVESLQLNVSQTINYCTLEVMREDDEHLKEIICFWKFLRTSVIFGTAGLFLASRNLNCCYTTFTSHLPARFYEYFLTWGLTHAEHLLPDSDTFRRQSQEEGAQCVWHRCSDLMTCFVFCTFSHCTDYRVNLQGCLLVGKLDALNVALK